jgi:succinate dehydrogenase / fumarate reductase membrane anchor subunit
MESLFMNFQAKGLQAWLFQRLTGAFMALYLCYFLGVLLTTDTMTYSLWLQWFSHPLMNTATGLLFIQLAIHAWVGMRDIVLDYVPNDLLRLFMLAGISFFLVIMTLAMLRILFSLILI